MKNVTLVLTVRRCGIWQLPTANPTVSFALSHWYTSKYPVGPQFTIVALRRCRLQCSFVHWASASLHPAQRALSSCPVASQLGDSWPGKRSKYQIAQKQAARFCVLLAFVVSGSYLSSLGIFAHLWAKKHRDLGIFVSRLTGGYQKRLPKSCQVWVKNIFEFSNWP